MRNGIAAILVAALAVMGAAASALADSQSGHGTMSGSSGAGTPSGSGSSAPDSGATGTSDSRAPFAAISVEGWEGGAYRNSKNEVYCELSDDYGSGVSLILGWDQYGFYLAITDPATFNLDDMADGFGAKISIDRIYKGTVPAYYWGTHELELDFGEDSRGVAALRKGVKLVLEDWDHWYTLYGTNAAIAAVEDCFNRYR
jgi:hypothetical protein